MSERRQVHRRESIEVETTTGDVLVARPLPWLVRNDLGDIIVKSHQDGINEIARMFVMDVQTDGDVTRVPQIELGLQQKIRDWAPILMKAYPDQLSPELLERLEFEDCVELAITALEVNHLEQLRDLVDPNAPSPTIPGGADSTEPAGTEATPKIESSPDSSSPDLTVVPSSS